jgi:hypothetical protein
MRKRLFFCILSALLLFSCSNSQGEQQAAMTIDTIPQLVTQIQKTSKLYTSEYRVHKIITHDDELQLKGSFMKQDFEITLPAGKRKVAIPIDATLKAYIDFDGFSEQNVQRQGNKINILLPDPKVQLTSSKIDHRNIKKYVALLRRDFTDAELTSYERQGREAIIKSVPAMGIVESARKNAARTLIPMIKQLGYAEQDITITFRQDLDTEAIIERSKE